VVAWDASALCTETARDATTEPGYDRLGTHAAAVAGPAWGVRRLASGPAAVAGVANVLVDLEVLFGNL
jgi:hypothetical protein